MYIYKITCKVNNKVYIGQTTETLEKRFRRHMGYQKDSHDTKFYRAVRKYGVDNFYIELLDKATSRLELNLLEEHYIKAYNSIEEGYNTALGKIGGDTLSKNPNLPQIKEKLKLSKQGSKNPQATKIKVIYIKLGLKRVFDSMSECQEVLNIPRHDIISKRCRGIINKPYENKYMFEYI